VKTEAQIRKELDDALLQSAAMENEAWHSPESQDTDTYGASERLIGFIEGLSFVLEELYDAR
jgi:hypothetical protein